MKCFTIISLCFLLLWSCNSKERKIRKIVEAWQGKEILFPPHFELKSFGRDTSLEAILGKEYKIFNYIDTNGCTECRLKLEGWQNLKAEADSLHLNVTFLFAAYVKNYEELEMFQYINRFEGIFIYDRNNRMDSLNHFPASPLFRTFLLDSENRVILVGNPVENERLWELYKIRMKNEKP